MNVSSVAAHTGVGVILAATILPATAASLPLVFEENRGQTDSQVRFLARAADHTLFLTGDGAVLRFSGGSVGLHFGARRAGPEVVEGLDPTGGVSNYLGPRRVTGIPQFGRVRYREVWHGIDVIFRGSGGEAEYDFVLAAGADPSAILLEFEAADQIHEAGGDLILRMAGGEIRQRAPAIYQSGHRVPGSYLLHGNRVRFRVSDFDHRKPLVIDPVLSYVVRFGPRSAVGLSIITGLTGQVSLNSFDRGGTAIAVDSAGSAYVAGSAFTVDFPTTPGSFQPNLNAPTNTALFSEINDTFVMKLSPNGKTLVYSTFLGGSGDDVATGIAIDADGNAYVCGATSSFDFPVTPGAVQTTHKGVSGSALRYTGFLAKLNTAGSALVYSTYLGGSSQEDVRGIALDAARNAYITGVTFSPDFPTTTGSFQPAFNVSGASLAYAAKVNPTGTALVYSTFLGNASFLIPPAIPLYVTTAITVDAAGNAYLGGNAISSFPSTPGAYQTQTGSAFVLKLNAAGSALVFSTFLGPVSLTGVDAIAVDSSGSVYAAGHTNSDSFPTTPGSLQPSVSADFPNLISQGRYPPYGFVTKLKQDGSGLVYSTYLGGGGSIVVGAIVVDAQGNAFVAGSADASSFITTADAVQPCLGDQLGYSNAFLLKLDASGSRLLYSTFLGGNVREQGFGLAIDAADNAYVSGMADSTNFDPTPGAAGVPGGQAFVAKIDFSVPNPFGVTCVANTASMVPGAVAPGEIVSIFGTGLGPTTPQAGHLTNNIFDNTLAGTQVLFDGVAAPLLMVSSNQINAVVPSVVRFRGQTAVQVSVNGRQTTPVNVPVTTQSPAFFTLNGLGTGRAAALNQDGTVNSPSNPAARGSIVSIFANSAGFWSPAMGDGLVAPAPLFSFIAGSGIQIGGVQNFALLYSGNAPTQVTALWQINATVPTNIVAGSFVALRFASSAVPVGQRVTISIK